jgi:pimeloyl-ACP methyl ester carboxylesterase
MVAGMYHRLASFSRLIHFDRRGSGASDPLPLEALPSWESYVDEVVAVMDAAGSERAAIMGIFDAGPMATLFAATRPDRTVALILAVQLARAVRRFLTSFEVVRRTVLISSSPYQICIGWLDISCQDHHECWPAWPCRGRSGPLGVCHSPPPTGRGRPERSRPGAV